jgi:hypothetical protein
MELPPLPTQLPVHRTLRALDDDKSCAVLRLAAWAGQMAQWSGAAFHFLLGQWLETGLAMEGDLRAWLREEVPAIAAGLGITSPKAAAEDAVRLDQARWQAQAWWQQGWRVHIWEDGYQPATLEDHGVCPRVLFSRGEVTSDRCRVAVFNSRKPRRFHAQEPWLVTLRQVLAALAERHISLASSRGTFSYDLVSCFAQIRGVPLMYVTTDGLPNERERAGPAMGGAAGGDKRPEAGDEWSRHLGLLTCALQPVRCPKVRRMACRDRLLAHLADLHVVLALRDKGNLLGILREQQQVQPKWQWIFEESKEVTCMQGNRVLARDFPGWHQPLFVSTRIKAEVPIASPLEKRRLECLGSNPSLANGGNGDLCLEVDNPESSASTPTGPAPRLGDRSAPIAWDRYLYHYTRACPGPWPGQSEFDYLTSVLAGQPSCGHSALDTLLRILKESRIHGSHRLVRGLEAVISLTSRPPPELAAIRHWNRALGRWTFEPYGIAVNRRWLRDRGAKPAIYGAGRTFQRLPPHQRFRFQAGDANRAVWRREREWRLPGDLQLSASMDVLVLVPDAAAADRVAAEVDCPYGVVVF